MEKEKINDQAVVKPWQVVMAWTAGTILLGIVWSGFGAIAAGFGAYRVWKACSFSTGWQKVALTVVAAMAANVSLTTAWYGTLGNDFDSGLSSKRFCIESGEADTDSRVWSKRDLVLLDRQVSRSISCAHYYTPGQEDSYHVSGLAIWWPLFSTELPKGAYVEIGTEDAVVIKE